MKTSFVYYLDWAEQLLNLPAELRLKIDDAIKRYVLYGEEPTDREVLYSMFGLIRMQLDRDVEKWTDTCKARSEAGKKGMKKRWGDNKHNKNNKCYQNVTRVTDNVNDNDNVNVSTDVDIKSTNVDKEKPTNVGKESAFSFDDFWKAYGKMIDRRKCEKKWESLTEEQKELVMDHVPRYVTSASGREQKYRKNPLTYLNGECWNDEIIQDSAKANGVTVAPECTNEEYRQSKFTFTQRSGNAAPKRSVDDFDEKDD